MLHFIFLKRNYVAAINQGYVLFFFFFFFEMCMSHILRNEPSERGNSSRVPLIQGDAQSSSFCSPNNCWDGGSLTWVIIAQVTTAA